MTTPVLDLKQATYTALVELQQLLTPQERWTQRAYARDAYGNEVEPLAPNATCFCTLGGIRKVANGRVPVRYAMMAALEPHFEDHDVVGTNDRNAPDISHGLVLAGIAAAVEAYRPKSQS